MKKYFRSISIFLFTTVIIVSCEKEQLFLLLSIQGFSETQTRTNESGFEDGDQVGIYVVDNVNGSAGTLSTTGNHANNVKFTYTSTGNIWSPVVGSEIYWNDSKTKIDIYSYYPYSSSVSSVTTYPFSVNSDQSNSVNYYKSDFLWAKASNVTSQTSPVNLFFGHKLSKVVLTTTVGDGFTTEEYNSTTKSMQLLGTKLSSTINLSTGVATATGSTGTITPLNSGNTYSAIVVPQSLDPETTFIKMTVNGVEYSYALNITFEANKQYNISVKVSKNRIDAVINGITAWDVDPTTYNPEKIVYPMKGLIAWYPFNGNAHDESGNSNHGTVYGSNSTTDRFGEDNKAYLFNGLSNDIRINLSSINNKFANGVDVTINAWIKTSDLYGPIVSLRGVNPVFDFCIGALGQEVTFPGKIGVLVRNDLTISSLSIFSKLVNDDQWHMVTAVRTSSTGIIKIYIDGKLESTSLSDQAGSITFNNLYMSIGSEQVWIQQNNDKTTIDEEYFSGKIDDIRIYNRALTDGEITVLYRQ